MMLGRRSEIAEKPPRKEKPGAREFATTDIEARPRRPEATSPAGRNPGAAGLSVARPSSVRLNRSKRLSGSSGSAVVSRRRPHERRVLLPAQSGKRLKRKMMMEIMRMRSPTRRKRRSSAPSMCRRHRLRELRLLGCRRRRRTSGEDRAEISGLRRDQGRREATVRLSSRIPGRRPQRLPRSRAHLPGEAGRLSLRRSTRRP